MFDIFAHTLSAIYEFVPNYAIAIALFTLLAMVITTPFTLKGTRSMIQMQRLQPEMRKLQVKYKDDRQKLNEELMAFYKENNLNPLGGCLPLLLQTPIFIILYNVISGLTRVEDGTFDPKYLKESSDLYQALTPVDEMMAFGVDLAESASKALQEGFLTGLPHVVMVVIVALTSYYQQKQIQGRNPNVEMPPQQKMMMRLFPAMFVVIAFVSPSALVVYFVVSNLYRIGMQAYITRTLYHGDDSMGAQAARASAEARKLREEQGGPGLIPKVGRRGADPKPTDKPAEKPAPAADESSGGSNGSEATPRSTPPPTSRTTPASSNRSKKKKKRR